MPVKNAAPFIKDCIESICKQTYTNWELIAVDDHSTDQSYEIISQYESKNEKIHLLKSKGNGIIPALQMGYSHSSGKYIHRMDADDIMPVSKLSNLFELISHFGKGHVATAHVSYFSDQKLNAGYQNYAKWLNQLCENNNHWGAIFKECVIASPNWLIARDDFERVGGFNSFQYPEDYDLVFRFYKANLKVVSLHEVTHLWRDHEKRSSRTMEIYKDNAYFDLKWHYFKELKLNHNRPTVIWGAGPKGKRLVKTIQKDGHPITWVSNNPNKHGKNIYNEILESYQEIINEKNPQILVAVGQRKAQKEICNFLNSNNYSEGKDYFFL